MNKNTKTIIIIIVALAVLALVFAWQKKQASKDNDPEVKEEIKGWDTFTDRSKAVSFMHDPRLQINQGNPEAPATGWSRNSTLPGIILAEANMPGPSLSSRLTIGRSSDAEAITACTTGAALEKSMGTSEIDGHPFIRFISTKINGADTSETTSYRSIIDGECYAVEYTINTSGTETAPPASENVNLMQRELENIVQSMKFLVNSD